MTTLAHGMDARRRAQSVVLAVLALSLAVVPMRSLSADAERLVSVIVRGLPGAGDTAVRTVEGAGGVVGVRIGILDGFEARIPASRLGSVRSSSGIRSVTPNVPMQLQSQSYEPQTDPGSMWTTNKSVKAHRAWLLGYTGRNVDVALIDSGVVSSVNGLRQPGKVILGADLSFDSQVSNLRNLDAFGHGTHLAGVIAGKDDGAGTGLLGLPSLFDDPDDFVGVAPGARLVSVKVANAAGVTDVSQVLAGISWVVEHRRDDGMNIRVLNLAFGTDGVQSYVVDPLTYAVEVAWRAGIVVVVSAGNSQFGSSKLNNPAFDPFVIAVGANDTRGTYDTGDDQVPSWSARGDGTRNPDLVAPGKSLVSLRVPGSYIDQRYPSGSVTSRFFRGSGTSQAAAVVSGAVAVLLEQRPNLTPNQVKSILKSSASELPVADPISQGAGELDLREALREPTPPNAAQPFAPSTGTGSLELSRGSAHVADQDGNVLTSEMDIFGMAWDGQSWSESASAGQTWTGDTWNGQTWSGQTWSGQTWSGQTWSGQTWSGQTWSGQAWSGQTWSGQTWSGQTWSGQTWSGQTWSGASWD